MMYQAYVVLFCFHTGCRYPSELNRLTWSNIKFEDDTILIMGRKSKGKVINTRFPMFPILKEVLSDIKMWHPDSQPEDYVFKDQNGNRIKNIRKSFLSAIAACGLEKKIDCMYGLRHSFATHWIHTKMPLNGIANLMGHADTVMLERRYAHLVSDKVNDHFQEAYSAMNEQKILSIIGMSKQSTLFDDDSLENYRKLINKEFVPSIIKETM